MNIEFKTHQMVVAGMQTQINLLTQRCIEWQNKLAKENQEHTTTFTAACKAAETRDELSRLLVQVNSVLLGQTPPEEIDTLDLQTPAVLRTAAMKRQELEGFRQLEEDREAKRVAKVKSRKRK